MGLVRGDPAVPHARRALDLQALVELLHVESHVSREAKVDWRGTKEGGRAGEERARDDGESERAPETCGDVESD